MAEKQVFWTRLDVSTRKALDRLAKQHARSSAGEARFAIEQYVAAQKLLSLGRNNEA